MNGNIPARFGIILLGLLIFESPLTLAQCSAGYFCPCVVLNENTSTAVAACRCTCAKCRPGEYCPVGSVNPSSEVLVLLCPAGSYCPSPSNKVPCPIGYFCPAGTADYRRYPCVPVAAALFCPQGSEEPLPCPAGSYCPSAAQRLECPAGHYCTAGVSEPRPCSPFTDCPKGNSAPSISLLGAIAVGLAIAGRLLLYLVFLVMRYLRRLRSRDITAAKQQASLTQSTHDSQLRPEDVPALVAALGWRMPAVMQPNGQYAFPRVAGPDELRAKLATADARERFVQMATHPGLQPALRAVLAHVFGSSPMSVGFEDMSVTLPSGKRILEGVTGEFRPGRMCAVMGPSGAGKSTLLTALLGLNAGRVGGAITVNGQRRALREFRAQVAFVPQDDIVLPELTVTDNLYYSCLWRQPDDGSKRGVSSTTRRAIVARTVALLGLDHVRDSVVGDAEERGISGGQRKRVNIGLELVASPSVLFLDEPTSGLDSTSSLEILQSLKEMALQSDLTIAAVIHQPRQSIFFMFDDVLLLAKGGRTVFAGPTRSALQYFAGLGHHCPPQENPADFLMDVIAANPGLADHWAARSGAAQPPMALPPPKRRTPSSGRHQFLCVGRRTLSQIQSRRMELFVDFVLICLAAAGCGYVFGPNGKWDYTRLEAVLLFSLTAQGLLTCMAALNVFGPERLFYQRELPAGLRVGSYFLAKNVVFLYDVGLRSFVFAGVFYNFVQLYMTFRDFFICCVLVTWSCSGLGYLLSVLAHPRNALLAAVVVPFVLGALFSGFIQSLKDLDSSPVMYGVAQFSFGRWGLEALAYLEDTAYPSALRPTVEAMLAARGYTLTEQQYRRCLTQLGLQGLLFRVVAYVALICRPLMGKVITGVVVPIVMCCSRDSKKKQKTGEAQPLVSPL